MEVERPIEHMARIGFFSPPADSSQAEGVVDSSFTVDRIMQLKPAPRRNGRKRCSLGSRLEARRAVWRSTLCFLTCRLLSLHDREAVAHGGFVVDEGGVQARPVEVEHERAKDIQR